MTPRLSGAVPHHNIAETIKNSHGDFLYLRDLIAKTVAEPSWNLGRNTKTALPRLKSIGDLSAHSRRYVAHRNDIDKVIDDLRVVVQESGLSCSTEMTPDDGSETYVILLIFWDFKVHLY